MVCEIQRVVLMASLVVAVSAGVAQAHIDVTMGGTHQSRVAGSSLKTAPCGTGNSTRGANVYTYRPGATITLSLTETIPHPGYFRIAFDDDGTDDFVTPSGTDGMGGNCAGDPKCGPGLADFCNNHTVLLDNIDPHASAGFGTQRTWSVTLPNVECDNCTLQVIQVMNDLNIHPTPYPADDIYYHCIDLVLSSDAPEVTETPVATEAMVCAGGGSTGGGGMTGGGSGGVGGTGGMTGGGIGGSGGMTGGGGVGAGGAVGAGGVTGGGGPLSGGGTPTGSSTGGDDSSGCSVSRGRSHVGGVWMLLALSLLGFRRRRA